VHQSEGHVARANTTYEAAVQNRLETCRAVQATKRQGCGGLTVFVCTVQMGPMTGLNLVKDGGS
jgi:3-oxoacyl-[acyl-carrier protein] reductase